MNQVGERINHFRVLQDITQKDLANRAGLSDVSISKYENGLRNPKIQALIKIAIALGVDIGELLNGDLDNQVGNRIKYFRTLKKMTQKTLAEKTKLSEDSIRKYEGGKRNPRIESLVSIAGALEITLKDLSGDNLNSEIEDFYENTFHEFQKEVEARKKQEINEKINENILSIISLVNRMDGQSKDINKFSEQDKFEINQSMVALIKVKLSFIQESENR